MPRSELLARHCTEAGLVTKAVGLWGKAGLRSLGRSALVEAVEQLRRALDQIEPLAADPVSRRERLKLQVAIIAPLIHVKGYASEETKAAVERAHRLIEEAENLGGPPEDPLLLFSVLYASVIAHQIAFDGKALLESAARFLALAEKRKSAIPIMVGHRLTGNSLLLTGNIVEGRAHFDQAIARYNPLEHRDLVTRFGQDSRVSGLAYRSIALWMLGYPQGGAQGCRQRDQRCARNRPGGYVDVCATGDIRNAVPLRKVHGGKSAVGGTHCLSNRKRHFVLEGRGDVGQRVSSCRDRQTFRGNRRHYVLDRPIPVNGSNVVHSNIFVILSRCSC
jgi:hypothetical protein